MTSGIARDIFPEVARISPRPEIMGIAGKITDDNSQRFTLVKRSLGNGGFRTEK
jgi:hypothetical protein